MTGEVHRPVLGRVERDAGHVALQEGTDIRHRTGTAQVLVLRVEDAPDAVEPIDQRQARHPGDSDGEGPEEEPCPRNPTSCRHGEADAEHGENDGRKRSEPDPRVPVRMQRRKGLHVNVPARDDRHDHGEGDEPERDAQADTCSPPGAAGTPAPASRARRGVQRPGAVLSSSAGVDRHSPMLCSHLPGHGCQPLRSANAPRDSVPEPSHLRRDPLGGAVIE